MDGYDEKRIEKREHEFAKAQEAASDCLPLIIKEVVGCPFIRCSEAGRVDSQNIRRSEGRGIRHATYTPTKLGYD